ncbi:bacterio-opsin activator domain-containing protein [Halalkaliarchaeum sp. AArc-GB]|uniref:bacterio-opsin activator domain-containing protein n=1 Tax=unclassified Halalkaliarchaeum TaxID=2678344 RepID=UPI00217D3079|nr:MULTISPECIES: bacterio-opsin activator domain-containing protein [unclassified Halalkaliarchaeum]MDR5674060.1 bacterio-opsin activator domain-containing protein [Halalkaliarchaeum sp. AArc-GB]
METGEGVVGSLFEDPDRFVAILDADGTVREINDAATGRLNASREHLEGKRFWALPWQGDVETRRRLQHAVTDAADGEYANVEATIAPRPNGGDPADAETKLEFRFQPIGDGSRSDGGRILVQGSLQAERERLERELRQSEQLHRVTLTNMTETILVTNDEGEFTYVCPNVHFIFGYTVEEIHEFGTIDALLGGDLFDRERLESEGVLTNLECTATDKDGDEHALLVNVRQVSIQGGTTLYSCRDITKRKQRETALTQLQETSRELLYAETKAEIATRVAKDATTALSNGGVALYRFDREENVLYPMAVSQPLLLAAGSLPDVSLDQETCISRAYVDGRRTTRSDVDKSDLPDSLLGTLSGVVAVPLDDHGVLLAAATGEAELADVDEEIAELLAATTEAAFDRLERETQLRERDETLKKRNRRLTEANRLNEIIREIDRILVNADSRAEIERGVCERLATSDRFTFVWIGEATARDRHLRPREWAGDGSGYLDDISLSVQEDMEIQEPTLQTARNRSTTVVPNVADVLQEADWCKQAVSRQFDSIMSVPLMYDDVLFGTLTVYDDEPDSFSDTVRSVFEELGATIGSAINDVQRKEALQSDTVFRLSYRLEDPASILSRLATALDCRLEVRSEVTRTDESTVVFVDVEGASPEAVAAEATELVSVRDCEVIRESGEGGLVSLTVDEPFVTSLLANHGATRRTLTATPEALDLVVDVPDAATSRSVDELLSTQFAEVELTARQKQLRSRDTDHDVGALLTARQEEVARVAYHSGFFEPNRNVSGREIADTLDISHTAFYNHVRRVQDKLFTSLFDSGDEYITVE